MGENPIFEYTDEMGSTPSGFVRFPVEISNGKWRQIAYSIHSGNVTLILDCDTVITRSLVKKYVTIGSNTVTSIGKTFIESSRYPRFVVGIQICL